MKVSTIAGIPSKSGFQNGEGKIAQFNGPGGVVVDKKGNLFVTDTKNHVIRKISYSGVVSTFAGSPKIQGLKDGIGSDAKFNTPWGITMDDCGEFYVTDTVNNAIRKISADSTVKTIVSPNVDGRGNKFQYPKGICWFAGELFVVDDFHHCIKKISKDGEVSIIVGNDSWDIQFGSRLSFPKGITVDSKGQLYIADFGNFLIKKVSTEGIITIAGEYQKGGHMDGCGTEANFCYPHGVAVDDQFNVYISDSDNHSLRKITADGVVTTLAGNPELCGNEDGFGRNATFQDPRLIAIDELGIYVTDFVAHTVRMLHFPHKWTSNNHYRFPKEFREQVICMMMLFRRKNCILSNLPKEILFLVIRYCS